MASGDALRAFLKKGIRSSFQPSSGISRLAIASAVVLAGSVASIAPQAAFAQTSKAPLVRNVNTNSAAQLASDMLSRRQIISTADMLDQQGAMRRLVKLETDRRPDVPDLERAMLVYMHFVQEKGIDADPNSNNLFGLGPDMTAWMMRLYAKDAGLERYMDGITVNEDGSVDAKNPAALARMLEIRNNPAASIRLFASWYAAEIRNFDGQTGRAPTPGETLVIGLTDSFGAMDAAHMAKNYPTDKLGPEIQIRTGTWQRSFFIDQKGWTGAKDAMASIEKQVADRSANFRAGITPRAAAAPMLDEDFTAATLRKDPERFARIVSEASDNIPPGILKVLDKAVSSVDKGPGLTDDEIRQRVSLILLASTGTIDDLRGDDVSGGIYAMSEGQWLTALEAYGDTTFKASFMGGIDFKADGSIHTKSAAQFDTLMGLRDHGPIASQIVAAKTAVTFGTLTRSLNRMPDIADVSIAHLFGVAAAENLSKQADRRAPGAPDLRFQDGDPRQDWGKVLNSDRFTSVSLHKTLERTGEEVAATYMPLVVKNEAPAPGPR